MAKSKIYHFRRSNLGAPEKELVGEEVGKGSDTARFMKQLEYRRLRRPCYQTVDMRGKVRMECRKYVINDRVYYMDDVSFRIYTEGAKRNAGVFTVGTYETIVNGPHTLKRPAKKAAKPAESSPAEPPVSKPPPPESAQEPAKHAVANLYQPQVLTFGYFMKRSEPRLQLESAMLFQVDGQQYRGVCLNISTHGLRVRMDEPTNLLEGQIVSVTFADLMQEYGHAWLRSLPYEVVSCRAEGDEGLLGLRISKNAVVPELEGFFAKLIKDHPDSYKLDVEDDYWSISAWLYERLYTENQLHIPFFIARSPAGQLHVNAVAVTDGNRPLSQFFATEDENYDFSALCLPQRVEHLIKRGEMLIMLYREKREGRYRVHSIADPDFKGTLHKRRMLRFVLARREHCVIKVVAARIPAKKPGHRKLEMLTHRLADKSVEEAEQLKRHISELYCVGTLIDVTQQLQDTLDTEAPLDDMSDLLCWEGDAQLRVADGEPTGHHVPVQDPPPEVLHFGYLERRREDRFFAETAVELRVGNGHYKGKTRDLSSRGLGVVTDELQTARVGDEVRVAFTSLQKKRPQTDISDVGYQIVAMHQDESNVTIFLERLADGKQELNEFFVELIRKNRDKLTMDLEDIRSAAASRVYESVVADNLVTIPFFLYRAEQGLAMVQRVAVPEASSELADFFRGNDGEYDFSWLTDRRLITAIYSQLGDMSLTSARQQDRPPPVEFEMYFSREPDPEEFGGRFKAVSGLEFDNARELDQFIGQCVTAGNYRFVKVMITYTLALDKHEMTDAIDTIREHSRAHALRLKDELGAVIGYGELIDITDQIAAAHGAN